MTKMIKAYRKKRDRPPSFNEEDFDQPEQQLSDSEQEALTKKLTQKALSWILRYQAKRDHSRLELVQKLSQRFESEAIEEALSQAQAKKWLCDEEDLSERVALRLHDKFKGRRYIEAYLMEKGLPPTSWDEGIEQEKAKKLLEIKFGEEFIYDFTTRPKAMRYLVNRGFTMTTIRKVLNDRS